MPTDKQDDAAAPAAGADEEETQGAGQPIGGGVIPQAEPGETPVKEKQKRDA